MGSLAAASPGTDFCNVKRIDAASLTDAELATSLKRSNEPLLLTHLVNRWPAAQKWASRETLMQALHRCEGVGA